MAKIKKQRLGRGLNALIGQPVAVEPPQQPDSTPHAGDPPNDVLPAAEPATGEFTTEAKNDPKDLVHYIKLQSIRPNSRQPRQHFDEQALTGLAQSIKAEGVMQPIVLRRIAGGAHAEHAYELVAGERRWRAAALAGLDAIPAVLRDLDDRQMAQWALVENLQREDLNAIERAEAFKGLSEQFAMSHEEIAQNVGVERSTVSNTMRLLQLDPTIQAHVIEGRMSAGHARCIASLHDPETQRLLGDRIIRRNMTVRQAEEAARQLAGTDQTLAPTNTVTNARTSPHLNDLARQITEHLGMKAQVKAARRKGAGALTIQFGNLDEFDQLLQRLGVPMDP